MNSPENLNFIQSKLIIINISRKFSDWLKIQNMQFTDQEYQEYKQELDANGFVVVKAMVTPTRAKELQTGFFDYLERLNPQIKRNDPKTWSGPQFPSTVNGIFKNYNVGHIKPLWEARCEPKISEFFQRYWETKQVIVSFDGVCLLKPNGNGIPKAPRFHTDQAPKLKFSKEVASVGERYGGDRGFMSIQGILNLEECGDQDGGLYILKGSHKEHSKFFDESKNRDQTENWYQYANPKRSEVDTDESFALKLKMGLEYVAKFEKVKVNAKAGDMILFYSRSAHCVVPTEKDSKTFRLAFYITMFPKALATKSDLKKRTDALYNVRTTSHWPCIKFKLNSVNPNSYDGSKEVITNFDCAFVKDELEISETMLQLTGVSDMKRKQSDSIEVQKKQKK